MNIIYLHGFQSGILSTKGQFLKQYCETFNHIVVHLPDLNMPPLQVIESISRLIESLDDVVLIGSSLGGFYATLLVAKYHISAVLINPAMRPWQLFDDLFGKNQMPFAVTEQWFLDQEQLKDLENLATKIVPNRAKILLLLQQDDEILDYREAQRYYSEQWQYSMMITEVKGNHAMDNFAEKIPMLLQFLSDSIKLRK